MLEWPHRSNSPVVPEPRYFITGQVENNGWSLEDCAGR